MTEGFGNKEKKSASTAKIENFLWRQAVKIQVLGASDVVPKMFFRVEILRVMTP